MSWRLTEEVYAHAPHVSGHERNILLAIARAAHHEDDPAHSGGKLRKAGREWLAPRTCFLAERELLHAMGLERPAILDQANAQHDHPEAYAQALKRWNACRVAKQRALRRLEQDYGLQARTKRGGQVARKGRATVFRVPTIAELEASRERFSKRYACVALKGGE